MNYVYKKILKTYTFAFFSGLLFKLEIYSKFVNFWIVIFIQDSCMILMAIFLKLLTIHIGTNSHMYFTYLQYNFIKTKMIKMSFIFIIYIFLETKEGKCFTHDVWDLLWGRSVPTKPNLFSSNKVTSRKSKELWTKGSEWDNAAYKEKEKYLYFTHPAEDHTNFHPISTKEKE